MRIKDHPDHARSSELAGHRDIRLLDCVVVRIIDDNHVAIKIDGIPLPPEYAHAAGWSIAKHRLEPFDPPAAEDATVQRQEITA